MFLAMFVCLGWLLVVTPALAAEARYVYRQSDGMFLRGGYYDVEPDPATEGVVSLGERHPDPRLERADPASPTKTRPATAPEIAAYDAERTDTEAQATADRNKALKATLVCLRAQLNVLRAAPGPLPALTLAELRQCVVDAYKALGP